MASRSFENPLLSHARMRGMYRGLIEVRALKLVPRGLEACFVAATIDLHPGDFALATLGPRAPAYLRELGARTGNVSPKASAVRASLEHPNPRFPGTAPECLLCAAGAAMALQQSAGDAVAVALLEAGAEPQTTWLQALRTTQAANLPLIILALAAADSPDWTALGKQAKLPVIPVDASDAVALYRVAQESIVRARADRRGAVIECVATRADPVKLMAGQLLAKGIANERWTRTVEGQFARTVEQARQSP